MNTQEELLLPLYNFSQIVPLSECKKRNFCEKEPVKFYFLSGCSACKSNFQCAVTSAGHSQSWLPAQFDTKETTGASQRHSSTTRSIKFQPNVEDAVTSLGFASPGVGSQCITPMIDLLLCSGRDNNVRDRCGDVQLPCLCWIFGHKIIKERYF